ncbi:Fic/DOC family protein [Breznakia pachnodae]|uniref:protein adenylyltransferase n=1 Tax=Breznakia pachnodae TaxID=265178 RepID=A0ABU0E5M8_9FIRM|nr:Fic family protein [Breznakia pachnodae]MDQ0361820.1 cell filamentation protein [Breznakia pachnodae]
MIKNKLGIEKIAKLKKEEERISKQNAISFWMQKKYREIDFRKIDSLFVIHTMLFDDIYEWAGKLREVNLSKGGFQFANTNFLQENLKRIDEMPTASFEDIISKYVEINILHPFREGNGRSGRLWLDCLLLQELNVVIDWSKLDKEEYMYLMKESVKDSSQLIVELKNITTADVDNREIFFKGLDFSYYYEEQYEYSSDELADEMKCNNEINN